jgi:muramoyltetrapeptide carboxypeptidase LdcA involved in peptidoglycan recycling
MDALTIKYLNYALFESGERELEASSTYNDIGLDWNDPSTLERDRIYEANEGWKWDGEGSVEGVSWGGCVESIDEILRHGVQIPSLDDFNNVILITESSEEIPSADYVYRVYRALGERGILGRVQGVLVGRAKAWEFDKQKSAEEKKEYKQKQYEAILRAVREYNKTIPVVQNLDFGHTNPQIALPYGSRIRIDGVAKKLFAGF